MNKKKVKISLENPRLATRTCAPSDLRFSVYLIYMAAWRLRCLTSKTRKRFCKEVLPLAPPTPLSRSWQQPVEREKK